MSLWGSIISAGASLLGGFLSNSSSAKNVAASNQASLDAMREGNVFNREQSAIDWDRNWGAAQQTQEWNRQSMHLAHQLQSEQNAAQMGFQDAQASRQMAFQERLANTAHQREVADLRLAGLNPILSGTGGMGSITPGGAMGTGHAGGPGPSSMSPATSRSAGSQSAAFQSARISDIISPAVSSALATAQGLEQIQLTRDQQERTKAETIRTIAEADRTRFQANLDPIFAREERLQGVRHKEGEASTAQAEGERRNWLKHVDRHFLEMEREAALAFLKHQSSNMEATARSAKTKADLDAELSAYERIINMGEGATSAFANMVPRIKLWESPKTRGKEFSLGR